MTERLTYRVFKAFLAFLAFLALATAFVPLFARAETAPAVSAPLEQAEPLQVDGVSISDALTPLNPQPAPAVTAPAPSSLQDVDPWKIGQNVLIAVLNVLLSFGIPGVVISGMLDFIMKFVPWLAPFRNLVYDWILKKLDDIAHQKAERAVLYAGQVYKTELNNVIPGKGYENDPPRDEIIREAKFKRADIAFNEVMRTKAAKNEDQAERLIETAVASLKARGINP